MSMFRATNDPNSAVSTFSVTEASVIRVLLAVVTILVGSAQGVLAAESGDIDYSPEQLKFFESKIRPVLVEQCYRCHAIEGQAIRGGLQVDSREGLRGGGESGPAIVPGDLESSLLWSAINHDGFEMPPNRKLPANVLEDFREWILMGAPDPRGADVSKIQTKVSDEAIEAGRNFWSFQPPKVAKVPPVSDVRWADSAVDAWVYAALQREGLVPAQEASPEILIRRLTFDLVGLPPTVDDVDRFVKAYAKDATSAISSEVDRLLDSPQFGERWGRHWLDVARYAESSGKELDLAFPNAWRYRDYVIDSFNQDKPFDEFIREQIAGDLLPIKSDEEWTENLVATGFLALGPKSLSERNPRQFRADLVDEQIDVTTRVFLGVSVACARCHDHKFDPIGQQDYTALAGIFGSTETYFGGLPTQRLQQSSNLLLLPVGDQHVVTKQLSKEAFDALKNRVAETETELRQAEQDVRMQALRSQAANRNGVGNGDLKGFDPQEARQQVLVLERRLATLKVELNQYDEEGNVQSFCMGVQDRDQPQDARLLVRGEIDQPAHSIPRGGVRVLETQAMKIPSQSSGRLELAKWIASPENPLTARVMVNRIWMHLIGKPLVSEPDNFGFSGPAPSHPELLDTLAVDFVADGWSVKSLIRKITQSNAYRLSSAQSELSLKIDPENRWISHANPRRMEAEAMRDFMLAISGRLDLKRPWGSAIAELGTALVPPGFAEGAVTLGRAQVGRPFEIEKEVFRSVYLPVARNSVPRMLDVFDFAEPSMVVGMREVSSTATQSLYLMNNAFVMDQSEALANRIERETTNPREMIESAFRSIYGRLPDAEERLESLRFLRDIRLEGTPEVEMPGRRSRALGQAGGFGGPMMGRFGGMPGAANAAPLSPLAQLCQALFVSAEFRYVQ